MQRFLPHALHEARFIFATERSLTREIYRRSRSALTESSRKPDIQGALNWTAWVPSYLQ